jgi:two-component system response regulator YesN
MELYRVLLADDEEEIRQGISRKIDWSGLGFELAGQAENGAEALELAEQLRPDVVLTDIKMPFMDGLELCRRLKQQLPAAKLVVFSGFDDFEYARQAIGMNVSEYILKPINAPELSGVLARLREQLDERRLELRDLELLRRRYEESLPVLRELFYARLLAGQLSPEQVQERAALYEIDLSPGTWAAALIYVDGGGRTAKSGELLRLSVQTFFEKNFALQGCEVRTVLYNDTGAILAHLTGPEQIYPLTRELERLCAMAESYLEVLPTVGVGRPCNGPEELRASVEGARSALDYRMLTGGETVLYIGDLEPDQARWLSFEEEDQRRLAAAVKLGAPGQAEEIIRELMERLRSSRSSPAQCHLFCMEIVTSLIKLARTAGAEEIFAAGAADLTAITSLRSLEEMGRWLTGYCQSLQETLGHQRTDSAWRTVEKAKDYIARHYADSEMSVEALCAHLYLSPTYFSTLFKRETGMSFTGYVTEVRMNTAADLLRSTEEKTYLIAQRVGYSDPNYFSYVFKRRFGVSPTKYRVS